MAEPWSAAHAVAAPPPEAGRSRATDICASRHWAKTKQHYMKHQSFAVGMVLAGVFAAQAGELMIKSFDRNGRLTFQENPSVASYRVE